jgi:hypothetical protein
MNRNKRNELLKTASIYSVLFIVTSMSTSALLVPDAAASISCSGTPDDEWRAVYGHNTESTTMYGTKAYSQITELDICGTLDDISVGGSLVWVLHPDLQMMETGFYRGNYSTMGLESIDDPHYFWGRRNAANTTWDYSDISDGVEIYPSEDEWIYFSVYGNADTSDKDWHVNITKPRYYTIIINDLTLTYSYGTVSEVVMEIHNIESPTVNANFTQIQSAYTSGSPPSLFWDDWLTSVEASNSGGNPYHSHKQSVTAYCMDSESNEVCP